MTVTIPTQRVDFDSRGTRCAAWLTLPAGAGPHPAVVLVHGLGATHDMMLAQYEQHFAAAGIATLAFDYRHTGASEGQPRQHISTRDQCQDVVAAIAHLGGRADIDAARIGLWGTSLGAMNVIRVAGESRRRRRRGRAMPDRARARCCPPTRAVRGATSRAGDHRRPPARRDASRSPLRTDRGTAGRVRNGHGRGRRGRAGTRLCRQAGGSTTGSLPRTRWPW